MPKKILIAASIYPPDPGGPAVHAKAQYERFKDFGFETGLVALSHYRKWPKGIRHFLYFLKILSLAGKYDVIYAHDAVGAGIPALIAGRLSGKKVVARIGGDIAWERHAEGSSMSLREWYSAGMHKNDRMFLLSRFFLQRADLLVVIGKSLKNLYVEHYDIDPAKIKVILNPIPKTEAQTEIKEEKTIIFASRLVDYKNLDLVLKVLARIVPEHSDLKFLIIGVGPDKAGLQELSGKLGLESNVVFMDHSPQSEVLGKTSECLFTIAPALTEFNPNYVLQGIGMGKPFLMSREHDLPFEVPDFLLFDARSESELRERIEELLTPDGYRKAKDFVSQISLKVSWEDNLRENSESINELLSGSK